MKMKEAKAVYKLLQGKMKAVILVGSSVSVLVETFISCVTSGKSPKLPDKKD